MNIYTWLLRPILFRLDPENAHYLVLRLIKIFCVFPGCGFIAKKIFSIRDKRLNRELFGLLFTNPVGLAAGLDKNAEYIEELSMLGFGFIEVGTVTPLPQPGNSKPRMFRLPSDRALINRLGFNNKGAVAMAKRLKSRRTKIIIGGNIGKNKLTSNADAQKDYENCFRELYPFVDYFAVNVSSPNTPGLRSLQEKEPLRELLQKLQMINRELSEANKLTAKPILLKIAPDLTNQELDEIIEVVIATGLAGVIATNTTLSRENLSTSGVEVKEAGEGGLSGKPLCKRSTEVIRYLSSRSGNLFRIIGVGGIMSPEDALEKINAGADLIQLYTGFVYEGPSLIRKINERLLEETSDKN